MSSIQDIRAINTPQRSYMWEVEVQGLSTESLADMAFYAKTVSIPQISVEPIIINHKAAKTHHSGRDASAHTTTVTFWDDEAQTIHKYFNDWMGLMHNQTTGQGSARDIYSADLVIKLKDASDENITSTITLTGAFPTDMAEVALSYDTTEPVEYSITFNYETKDVT